VIDLDDVWQWPGHPAWWWRVMDAAWVQVGKSAGRFVDWLAPKLKMWDIRKAVIGHLAWNDPNSEWNLQYRRILWSRKIYDADDEDGDPVTPGMVAESVAQVLEYNNP